MYILDFLSVRKIINSNQNLILDMERRFINLEKFFNKNKKYLDNKEKQYTDIKLLTHKRCRWMQKKFLNYIVIHFQSTFFICHSSFLIVISKVKG